jgi:rhamnosyltransferase
MNTNAIIVTYNPPSEFCESLFHWRNQLDHMIIIDNGSAPENRSFFQQAIQDNLGNIEFIFNKTNLGIAAALNQGFARLVNQGSDLVFVFDQDSQPAPGMVETILDTFYSHPQREQIAIVAPMIEDPVGGITFRYIRPHGHFFFERIRSDSQKLEDVTIVITSGALYNLKAYQNIGPFRDDFFIDYVDTEYCLRAKQNGYTIIVNCQARLQHRLGNQQKRRVGPLTMHPTFHSPLRWYYISRNRIPMVLLYAFRFPHWFFYELVMNSNGLIRLLLFEDEKASKLLAMLLGTLDGLNRRMGPISNSKKALIAKNE